MSRKFKVSINGFNKEEVNSYIDLMIREFEVKEAKLNNELKDLKELNKEIVMKSEVQLREMDERFKVNQMELSREGAHLEEELVSSKNLLEEFKAKEVQFQREMSEMKDKHHLEMESIKEQTEERQNLLKHVLREKDTEIEKMREMMLEHKSKTEQDMKEFSEKINRLTERIQEKDSLINQLNQEIFKKDQQIGMHEHSLNNIKDNMQSKVDELKLALNEKTAISQQKEAEMLQLRARFEKENQQLSQNLKEKEKLLTELSLRNDEQLERALQGKEQENINLRMKLEEYKAVHKEEMEQVKFQLEHIGSEKLKLEQESIQKIEELKALNMELRRRNEEIRAEITETQNNKEQIADVLIAAKEKAVAIVEKAKLEAAHEYEKVQKSVLMEEEKLIMIRNEMKTLKMEIAGVLKNYQDQLGDIGDVELENTEKGSDHKIKWGSFGSTN